VAVAGGLAGVLFLVVFLERALILPLQTPA